MQPPAVSVLVVDDHPALRAGLEQLLDQEPGYRLRGAVPREAGLTACSPLKQRPRPPGVVLSSAYVDDVFAVPATLAQADAIVSKNDPVEVLLTAIDAVAAGESRVPPPDPELIE